MCANSQLTPSATDNCSHMTCIPGHCDLSTFKKQSKTSKDLKVNIRPKKSIYFCFALPVPGCPSSGPGAELQTRTHSNANKLGLSKITGAPPRHCWGPKIQMEKERSCCPASAPGTGVTTSRALSAPLHQQIKGTQQFNPSQEKGKPQKETLE